MQDTTRNSLSNIENLRFVWFFDLTARMTERPSPSEASPQADEKISAWLRHVRFGPPSM
jgi:hypothetical protein